MKLLNELSLPIVSTLPVSNDVGSIVVLESDGQIYYNDGSNWTVRKSTEKILTFGLQTTTTGDRNDASLVLPFSGTIVRWKLYSATSQSSVVNIKKNGTLLTNSNIPTISSNTLAYSSNLTGWTTTVSENDILIPTVVSKDNSNLLILQVVVQI